jgi:hypothetical protein
LFMSDIWSQCHNSNEYASINTKWCICTKLFTLA